MAEEAIKLGGKKKSTFMDQVKELLGEPLEVNTLTTLGDDEPYEIWHYRHPEAVRPIVDIDFDRQGRFQSYRLDT